MSDERTHALRQAALAGDQDALDRFVHAAAPAASTVSPAQALGRAALAGDEEALRIYVDMLAPGLLAAPPPPQEPPPIRSFSTQVIHAESSRRKDAWSSGTCHACGAGKGSAPCRDPEHAHYVCAHPNASVSGRDRRDVQYWCPDCRRLWWM